MATVQWVSSIGGDFNNALNWNTGVVPAEYDDAVISTSGSYTVTISANPIVANFTLNEDAAIVVETGIFVASGQFNIDAGTFSLALGGTLGAGILTNDATIEAVQLNASAEINATTLLNNGTILADKGDGLVIQGNNITNGGTLLIANGSNIGLSGNSTLSNTGEIDLVGSAPGAQSSSVASSQSFNNSGAINIDGLFFVNTSAFINNGDINIIGVNAVLGLEASTVVSGNGTIMVSGSSVSLQFVSSSNFVSGTVDLGGSNVRLTDYSGVLSLGPSVVIDHTAGTADIGDNDAPGDQIVNNGIITAEGSLGLLTIDPQSFVNYGYLIATNADHVVLNTQFSGGTIQILGAAEVETFGSVSGGTVGFFDGSNSLLKIENPQGFTDTITGFTQGNSIFLAGVSADQAHWANGTLSVGGVNLSVAGDYDGQTFVAHDGDGGVVVLLAPAQPHDYHAEAPTVSVPEGTAVTGELATFTDGNTVDVASQFTATINWGDGTTSSGTITGSNGSFSVAGTHTYADEGSYATSIVVENNADASQIDIAKQIIATEADVFTVLTAPAIGGTEGQPIGGPLATFSDQYANVASDFIATVNWGDGTSTSSTNPTSSSAVFVFVLPDGTIQVTGSHTYDTLPPDYYSGGRFTVSVTLADANGSATATATGNAVVNPPEGGIYFLTKGVDILTHGAGNDVFVATSNTLSRGDTIDGRIGTNTLRLSGGGTFNLSLPSELDHIAILQAQEGVGSAAQKIKLRAGTSLNVTVSSASGGNPAAGITILGAANSDVINLGSGIDNVTMGLGETLNGGGGNAVVSVTASTIADTINGGSGTTTLVVKGGGHATMGSNINGIDLVQLAAKTNFTANAEAGLSISGSTAGGDVITVGAADQTVMANGPNDIIKASAANAGALVQGLSAEDTMLEITTGGTAVINEQTAFVTIKLDAATNLILDTGAGLAVIGSSAADTITANGRGQTLTGGGGSDTLIGSTLGQDLFKDTGSGLNGDLIKNFLASDQIDISNFGFGGAILKATIHGGDTLVTVTSGGAKSVFSLAGSYSQAGFQLAPDSSGNGLLITHA